MAQSVARWDGERFVLLSRGQVMPGETVSEEEELTESLSFLS